MDTKTKLGKMVHKGSTACDEYAWEDTTRAIGELMGKGSYFKIEVQGFGWGNYNGSKVVEVMDEDELIGVILPKTECNFKVYEYGDGFAIDNAHHDKPCGGEWYYIEPITYEEYEEVRE